MRIWGFRHQISKAKYLQMSVANIWKLQENTAPLCRKISQNVGRTYREASGEHRDIVQNICETLRISAMRGSGYVWPGKLKRSPLPSGVMRRMQNILMECQRSRIPDVRHPGGMAVEQLHPDPPRGNVVRSPIRINFIRIPDLLMEKDFKASVLHVSELSIALPWILKNSPQSRIALVIKKLSKHQNLTQFD